MSAVPLQVHAFNGNTAETTTILPALRAFMVAHRVPQVTVVADAAMMSEANLKRIEDAGLRFIVGEEVANNPSRRVDLRGRPIYHHKRESIEAHLTIVMAALSVSRWLERTTDTSIKKIVQTLRRHRSIAIRTGDHILHAGTPVDDDTRAIVSAVRVAATGHYFEPSRVHPRR
jgi:transposase